MTLEVQAGVVVPQPPRATGRRRARDDQVAEAPAPAAPGKKTPGRSRSGGAKNWCFTWYPPMTTANIPDLDADDVCPVTHVLRPKLHPEMSAICAQLETCPRTGRLHWQGYCEMHNRVQLAQMKEVIGNTAHLEVRRGSQEQAKAYTRKVESGIAGTWFEKGVWHNPDAASMLAHCIQLIRDGKTLSFIIANYPATWACYHNAFSKAYRAFGERPPPFRSVICFCFYGETGAGKSRWVTAIRPHGYRKNCQNKWWCGLNNPERHRTLILEEFYGQFLPAEMLQILDGYPMRLEIKGGDEDSWWEEVLVTSNVHPAQWWAKSENIPNAVRLAIERRLPFNHVFDLSPVQGVLPNPKDIVRRMAEARDAWRAAQQDMNTANGRHGVLIAEAVNWAAEHFALDPITPPVAAEPAPVGAGVIEGRGAVLPPT